jgi:hypothetical protein
MMSSAIIKQIESRMDDIQNMWQILLIFIVVF